MQCTSVASTFLMSLKPTPSLANCTYVSTTELFVKFAHSVQFPNTHEKLCYFPTTRTCCLNNYGKIYHGERSVRKVELLVLAR